MSVKPEFAVYACSALCGTVCVMSNLDEIERKLLAGDSSLEAVGARLLLIRKALGLSQAQMADVMATSANNYQEMEYGHQYPRPYQIQLLMDAHGCDHNLVYGGKAAKAPPEVVLYVASKA